MKSAGVRVELAVGIACGDASTVVDMLGESTEGSGVIGKAREGLIIFGRRSRKIPSLPPPPSFSPFYPRMTVARDPASIYTSLPPLPPFSAQYDPLSSTLAERENLDQLAQLAQEGPANYVLRRILIDEAEKEETRRKRREKYDEGSDSDKGLNQRDPQDDDGEPPTKRKRTRSSSKKRGWSSTAAEGGDDEETQAEQQSSGLRKGKGKAKRQHRQLERPRLAQELPHTELPERGSLLWTRCFCGRR